MQVLPQRQDARRDARWLAAAKAAWLPQFGVFRAPDGCWFDAAEADRVVAWIEKYCRHVEGEWAGRPFILEAWQRAYVRTLFGWKRADGTRRFRQSYLEVPRKNGKSTLLAAIGLFLLFADREPGAQIYSAAADREQAAIVFSMARKMVAQEPALADRAEVFTKSIVNPRQASSYKALSADAYTKHGGNAHAVLFDELHVQKNRDLFDVLTTSMGARRQPLMLSITTAGFDRRSLCWEQHEFAIKVAEGTASGDSADEYLPAIFAAPTDADWTSPDVWALANPNLGKTIKVEYLAAQCDKAREVPAYENTFRQLHLNQWTEQAVRWMPLAVWDACAAPTDVGLDGYPCYAGLDLSTTSDLTALVLVFPSDDETFDILPRFWIPEEAVRVRSRRDRVPYEAWVRAGLVTQTPGEVVDYSFILKQIEEDAERYELKEVAIDRWNATKLMAELDDRRITAVPFGQGFASMSSPTKELMNLARQKRLRHAGNPVLRWNMANVVVRKDAAGNFKPDKERSSEKIDGAVALVMAIDRALRHGHGPATSSVYMSRGIRVLGAPA